MKHSNVWGAPPVNTLSAKLKKLSDLEISRHMATLMGYEFEAVGKNTFIPVVEEEGPSYFDWKLYNPIKHKDQCLEAIFKFGLGTLADRPDALEEIREGSMFHDVDIPTRMICRSILEEHLVEIPEDADS